MRAVTNLGALSARHQGFAGARTLWHPGVCMSEARVRRYTAGLDRAGDGMSSQD